MQFTHVCLLDTTVTQSLFVCFYYTRASEHHTISEWEKQREKRDYINYDETVMNWRKNTMATTSTVYYARTTIMYYIVFFLVIPTCKDDATNGNGLCRSVWDRKSDWSNFTTSQLAICQSLV